MGVPFEILIDEWISFKSFSNKNLLSLMNDFEDGRWRYGKFLNFVWDNVKETALSQRERVALIGQESSLLSRAAKNLKIDKNGGEIAEILLYAIMRHYYNALPVVPKIYYKQNTNDYAKGADSVHIVLEQDESFSIWFGEAKFYNSIESARLDKIIQSVSETLNSDKLKKENSIIVNLSEIDFIPEISESRKSKIKETLSGNISLDLLKPTLHIPIVLLYQFSEMRTWNSFGIAQKNLLIRHQKERANVYFEKQIEKCSKSIHLYSEIKFHLILFPVPDKEQIVGRFLNTAEILRNE